MSYYQVKELHKGIYSIFEPSEVFCYLLVGEKSALLYDTAFGFGPLVETVREITDLPLKIVLSHGHYDHVGGAALFDKAYIHPDDEVLCLKHASRTARRRALDNWGLHVPADFDKESYINKGAGDIKLLDVGFTFELGGLTAEIVALEGHTAGSVGLLVQEPKVLLASDALGPHVWMFLQESLEMKDYLAMLTRVQGLPFETFYIGHSDTTRPIADIQEYERIAKKASPANGKPYPNLPELGGLLYEENGVGIVFDPKKL